MSDYFTIIFSVYINTIFSAVCIAFNVITIIALSSKTFKKEIKRQYIFLVINSYANVFYITIVAMSLINKCSSLQVFCSSLFGSTFGQYFEMIFVILIRNILETFAYLAYMAFVFTRYLNIASSKNGILKKFNTISLKTYLFLTLLLSVLANVHIFFEIRARNGNKYQ